MSTNFSIFIAGAVALVNQRLKLQAAANDLNKELKKKDAHVTILSYEAFKDNQREYNAHIENDCDLIIFILDGVIGRHTLEEYVLAYKHYEKYGSPQIFVLMNKYDEVTPDIKFIEGLLAGTTEGYWRIYKNDEDLVFHATNRIRSFVDEKLQLQDSDSSEINLKKRESREEDKIVPKEPKIPKVNGRRVKKMILSALLCLLLVMGVASLYLVYRQSRQPDSMLLITGGGSAVNFIDSVYFKDKGRNFFLRDYPGGLYVHMPTSTAWKLLEEEAISIQPNGTRRYYPICVSADSAVDYNFTQTISNNHFTQKGTIVAFKLGQDPLMVYAHKDISMGNKVPGQLTIDELRKLIMNEARQPFTLFTTSPTSGTRAVYNAELAKCGMNFADSATVIFSEDSDLPHMNNQDRPYLILGSKYYSVKELEYAKGSEMFEYRVVNSDTHAPLQKPMFLYAMAYMESDKDLKFPKETIELLDFLGIDLTGKVGADGSITKKDSHIIIDFRNLPPHK